MTARRVRWGLLAALAMPWTALGQPAPTPPAAPAPLTPRDAVWTADLPPDATVRGMAFSPDGGRLYVLVDVPSVNLWTVLVWHWPEAVALLVMVFALMRLRRTLRRRPIIGEPQCRRCDYLLRELTVDRCPECGLELTPANRIIGRSRRPAVLAWTLLAAAAPAAVALAGHSLRPVRLLPSEWVDWPSTSACRWLTSAGLLRNEWVRGRIILLEFAPAGGDGFRIVRDEPDHGIPLPSELTCDRESVYWYIPPGSIGRFDARSGAMTGRFLFDEASRQWRRNGEPNADTAPPLPESSVSEWSNVLPPSGLSGTTMWTRLAGSRFRWARFKNPARWGCLIALWTDRWVGLLQCTNWHLYGVTLSPDHRFIVGIGSGDGRLYVYDVADILGAPANH